MDTETVADLAIKAINQQDAANAHNLEQAT